VRNLKDWSQIFSSSVWARGDPDAAQRTEAGHEADDSDLPSEAARRREDEARRSAC
jgi:hypothetical protein